MNLVTNIGFGKDLGATHTTSDHPVLSHVQSHSMSFPMRHPESLVVDREGDIGIVRLMYQLPNPVVALWKAYLGNRYWYGKQIRKLPWVGRAWAHARHSPGPSCGEGNANRKKTGS